MLSRSESSAILTLYLTGRSADGDLLACNDIGREGDSMLSLTLIFSNFHFAGVRERDGARRPAEGHRAAFLGHVGAVDKGRRALGEAGEPSLPFAW